MLTDRGKVLAEYWQRLRGDALLPASEDLKLEQLGKEVAACVYCEWDGAERLNILYAGATTVEELGAGTPEAHGLLEPVESCSLAQLAN